MLAKTLKLRRDAERRLDRTSPMPVFNGGAPDTVEGGGGENLDGYATKSELTSGLAGKSDTDHNHDADYSAIDHTHDFLDLTDTPSAYTGGAGKIVAVNSTADGLEFVAAPAAENGIPEGGTTNQLAAKNSNDDYDIKWVDAPAASNGIPPGGTTEQILSKIDGTDYNAHWVDKPMSGSSYDKYDPDAPPSSAHAKDDEFDDESINVKWSWANQGTATAEEGGKLSMISITPAGDSYWRCLTQAVPSGSWEAVAKMSWGGDYVADAYCGLVVLPATDGGVEALSIGKDGTTTPNRIRAERWTNFTTWGAERAYRSYGPTNAYLKIKWDGTNLTYYVSTDGIAYSRILAAFAPSITPGRVGIGARGYALPSYFEFFRVTAL